MNQNLIFYRENIDTEKLIRDFSLQLVLKNDRTSIFENADMRVCVDKLVIRVLVYDEQHCGVGQKVKEYFYSGII